MASNILNVLENVEKGRRNCIKNAKLANLPATDNMDIFNIGNLFLEQNNTEFIDPTTTWERSSDWWDIETIINEAQPIIQNETTYYPVYCVLLKDYAASTTVSKSSISNQTTDCDAYIFSDEPNTLYVGDQTHTWDVSKDKPCSLGYKTRYIIFYKLTKIMGNCRLGSFKMLAFASGDFTNTSSSSSFNITYNNYIEYIIIGENTKFGGGYAYNTVNASNSLKRIDFYSTSNINNSNGLISGIPTLVEVNCPNVAYAGSLISSVYLSKLNMPNLISCRTFATSIPNITIINAPLLQTVTGDSFSNLYKISKLNFPNLNTINSSYFAENCYSLTELLLPTLITLETRLCRSCYSLREFTFPNTFTSLTQPNQFENCYNLNTINLITNWRWSLNVKDTDLTHDCIIDMFNKLKDLTGEDSLTLTIGANNLAKVTDEEKILATNKNWILA